MRTGESDQVRSDRPHGGGESAERSPSTDEILGRAEKLWRWPESRGGRVPPSWALGVIVALLGWRVGFHPPWIGLDPSWTAGLAMATKEGLHFGTQVVFTYGPLGFLDGSIIWFGDLGVLAFLYSAALYVGFSVALVWALRRSLPIVPSVLIAFLVIALLPLLEQSILVAVIVCLGVLERERSQRTINLLVVGGASFAALEALGKLSTGPIVALLFLVAVIGVGARWWQVLGFLGLMGAEILLLWLLAGQSLSTIPDFLENTWQVVSGYSAAMLVQEQVAAWKVVLATIAAAIVTVGLVAASAQATLPGPPSTLGGHRTDGNSWVRGLQGGCRQDRRGASQPLLLDCLRPLDRDSLGQGQVALAVGRFGGDRRHGSTGSATRIVDQSQRHREREVRDGPISHPGQWIPAREADQRWALRVGNRVRPRSSDACRPAGPHGGHRTVGDRSRLGVSARLGSAARLSELPGLHVETRRCQCRQGRESHWTGPDLA